MPPLPDTHPDGDPFAAQDAERERNSLLGQMERRARDEAIQRGEIGSDGLASTPAAARDKDQDKLKARARTSLGVDKDGRELLVLDTSDDDDEPPSEGEAQMTDGEDDVSGSGAEDEDGEDASTDGTGADDDEDDDEEGEGEDEANASRVAQTDEGDDDDDDDSDEDDETDDDSSSIATGDRGQDGDGDVSMVDCGGVVKPKSPTKPRAEGQAEGTSTTGEGTPVDGGEVQLDENGQPIPKKEKKKRRRRALNRSPSPPPLVPKPPPPTVRLSIELPPRNTTTTPEYNVVELAKAAGILPSDEASKKDTPEDGDDESESDGQGGRRKKADKGKGKADGEGEQPIAAGEGDAEPPKKRRKRGPNVILGRFGGYDVNDPFVDDTEIDFYEPRHYHRPKQDGYFVCIGDVECAPRRGRVKGSKNKLKDENGNPLPTATAGHRRQSKKYVVGPDGKPMIISVETPQAGSSTAKIETPFGSVPAFGGVGSPAGSPAVQPQPARKPGEFSPELREDLEMLKRESAKESYEVKNKFPPHLKELLVSVAYHFLDLGEYDDYFFAELPKIFPYNLFTMKKLVKREVFAKRINDMTKEQDAYLDALNVGVKEAFDKQHAEFLKQKADYEKSKAEGGMPGAIKTPEPTATAVPGPPILAFGAAPSPAPGGADGSPAPAPETDGANADQPSEPRWKFRFNETLRHSLYYACDIEDKKSDLIIEKQTLEKSTTREINRERPHNAKAARKAMYQKILEMWPPEMMTTNQLSREISNYKLKLKKHGEIAD
ncbi:hypothetical protein JCM10212_004708 [Sporobolomyces blumeae]